MIIEFWKLSVVFAAYKMNLIVLYAYITGSNLTQVKA